MSFTKSCFDVKQREDNRTTMENISNIKCENIEIKSEYSYSDPRLQNLNYEAFDCTNTKLLTNYLRVKEEIEDICDETAVESCSDINFQYVAIESEKDYSGCSLQNLKVEPAYCTNEYQSEYVQPTDYSTLKRNDKLCDSPSQASDSQPGTLADRVAAYTSSKDWPTDLYEAVEALRPAEIPRGKRWRHRFRTTEGRMFWVSVWPRTMS